MAISDKFRNFAPTMKKETYIRRRATLKREMGSGLLLFLGNNEVGMNYADNTYRFRQDSSFLYFFGLDYAGLAAVIVKDSTQGVNVKFDGKNVTIDLYITVEYGTRITSVAHSVADSVKYQVEKMTGLHVENVNVHVKGLRVSTPDK